MVEVSSNKLATLLERFRDIKRKHDAVAADTGERFNVFSVLGLESDEVKTHSAMLAELLNPDGTHMQGVRFLRLFLEQLPIIHCGKDVDKSCLDFSNVKLDDFEVMTEASRGEFGCIDILLENNGANKRCIVIENKIYAKDQERQLGKYHDYAMEVCNKDENRFVVIYLTLYEEKPCAFTLGLLKPGQVLCVSYRKHIIKWLDECINSVDAKSIRVILFQYKSLLEQLTNQSMNQEFIMNTDSIFTNPENCKLIPDLEQEISGFKTCVQFSFWRELKMQLEACQALFIDEAEVRYVVYGGQDAGWGFCKEKSFEETIKHRRNSNYCALCGLAFVVERDKDKPRLFFSIQNEDSERSLFYGFFMIMVGSDSNEMVAQKLNEECTSDYNSYKERVKKLEEHGWVPCQPDSNDGFLLGYKYSDINGACLPRPMNKKFFKWVGDKDKRTEIIEKIVKDIAKLVDVFKKTKP